MPVCLACVPFEMATHAHTATRHARVSRLCQNGRVY
ncbi:hypothetical protein F383_28977 [Gossypium arboreum]|uniref:Uncharacterized protein n=1 Tax=Gossypium arboreum TaxID=29729 RepID=A0A0B0PDQ6_GOSAR|nr:hypothetical protein F383_28977 [Gossypium arboreum]